MTPKIFIISLDSAHIRRQKIISSLERENVDWEFFDAIKGENIEVLTHDAVDVAASMRFPGYLLKPNEVACFLSHKALWEKSIVLDEPIVVLEDDALLNKKFEGNLAKILKTLKFKKIDVLRLGNGGYKTEKKKIDDGEGFSIFRYKEDPLCALAYVVSPNAAIKLLQNSRKFSLPVDNYIWRSDIHGCLIFDVYPHIFQANDSGVSTIGSRVKPKVNILTKIKIEFFRALHRFKQKKFENDLYKKL